MRLQPAYENMGYHPYNVIGLDLAPSENDDGPVVPVRCDDRIARRNQLRGHTGVVYGVRRLCPRAVAIGARCPSSRYELGQRGQFFEPDLSNHETEGHCGISFLSLLAVVVYIWFRFGSLRYGLAAIAALVHDVVITMGLVAAAGLGLFYATPFGQALLLSDFKINLALVAAMLTIVGYSLNDTIVIFDRIRENRGRLASVTTSIVNNSINQTISRTLVTSVTTLLAVSTLYIFGGDGVHGFAFAMLIGVFVGTYSSVAIAAPLLLIGAATTTKQKSSDSAGHQDRPLPRIGCEVVNAADAIGLLH